MKRITRACRKLFLALTLLPGAQMAVVSPAQAQEARASYSQAELDRMLAPIALYPDSLLAQILMASTYPLEIADAARWTREYPGLRGDEAVRLVQDRDWDPSVKSLVAFPNVLQRMDENPEWTRSLGDAFLDQEPYVMETVQQLRRRARAAGSLVPDERLRVVEERGRVIIEPARPELLYVPYYDPWVAYGPWWWPSHPPVAWAPWPGYVVVQRPRAQVVFSFGPAVPISAGFFFGGVDWGRRQVEVVRINNYYVNRTAVVRDRPVQAIRPGRWEHDAWHRRGVAYVNPARNARPVAEERRDHDRDNDRDRGGARPTVSHQPRPRVDSHSPDNLRRARPSVSSPAPNANPPSPARQMQIEQARKFREERREADAPPPARLQQQKERAQRG